MSMLMMAEAIMKGGQFVFILDHFSQLTALLSTMSNTTLSTPLSSAIRLFDCGANHNNSNNNRSRETETAIYWLVKLNTAVTLVNLPVLYARTAAYKSNPQPQSCGRVRQRWSSF